MTSLVRYLHSGAFNCYSEPPQPWQLSECPTPALTRTWHDWSFVQCTAAFACCCCCTMPLLGQWCSCSCSILHVLELCDIDGTFDINDSMFDLDLNGGGRIRTLRQIMEATRRTFMMLTAGRHSKDSNLIVYNLHQPVKTDLHTHDWIGLDSSIFDTCNIIQQLLRASVMLWTVATASVWSLAPDKSPLLPCSVKWDLDITQLSVLLQCMPWCLGDASPRPRTSP